MNDLLLGTEARPDRDGCDCPRPYVLRCVHSPSGWILRLYSSKLEPPHTAGCTSEEKQDPDKAFHVYRELRPRTVEPCSECGCGLLIDCTSYSLVTATDSEADALAAFYAAEEALLRGAVDD